MKILFDHRLPFSLAHGGFQTQIEQSKAGLEKLGVEVEYFRWWDEKQKGDLIHHWTAPSVAYLKMARQQGTPVVVTHLFTATCNRSPMQLAVQAAITRTMLKVPGWGIIRDQLSWRSFQLASQMIVSLDSERKILRNIFDVPNERITNVPYGMHQDFLNAGQPTRTEPYLITTGTITERKRNVELAEMARAAQVPILFVGKPYSQDDPYWKKFATLIDNRFVLHRNHVDGRSEMIRLLQSSRGFVIYSQYENWCLSAHEAVACGIPVLVQDQPWSRECFGDQAHYLDTNGSSQNPARLRAFYDVCPKLSAPKIRLYSWDDVGSQLKACYESVLRS
jgi:glycosyltransferase involved in cell wall biosynthesis